MNAVVKLPPAATLESYDNLDPHDLADTMPMIEDKAFGELKADLSKNGLRVKIALFQGRILDGRNRYKALRELAYRFSEKTSRSSPALMPKPKPTLSPPT